MIKKSYLYISSIFLSLLLITPLVQAQGDPLAAAQKSINQARQLCSGISASERRLAKNAGYDLESLCNNLSSIELPKSIVKKKSKITSEEQGVKSQSNVAADKQSISIQSEVKSLSAFGYNLFAGKSSGFEPTTQTPVSPEYILGPGDTVLVILYGNLNKSFELEINRDGFIDMPELGPVSLAGLTFKEGKKLLQLRIDKLILGVESSVSLGALRSMQVTMLGEARKPGSYTISAHSTITNALFLTGGLSNIASLRKLQLKRAGKVIAELDLYDLLLNGDTSKDVQIQSGDAIYIPTVSKTASISGQVRRPAIYELKGQLTAQQLVELAGGLTPSAYSKTARIHRISNSGFLGVIDIDLTTPEGQKTLIKNGDDVFIDRVVKQQEMFVSLAGHVHHPGKFLWREGLRVLDLVETIDSLRPNADLDFAIITRKQPPVGEVEVLFVDMRAVLADPNSTANISFLPRDELTIYSNSPNRAKYFTELVELLKLQSRSGELAKIATISGTVRSPGQYPLTKGMTLSQLIAAAGGLNEEAYTQNVELSRHNFGDSEKVKLEHISIALSDALASRENDPQIQPYDVISVRTIPEFKQVLRIKISGEVRFPGSYTFNRGEKLSQVIKRAGGLTSLAHTEAAIFTREDIRQQEAKQIKELRERLRTDVAFSALEKVNGLDTSGLNQSIAILDKLDSSQALGRLVIDLKGILDKKLDDIALKDQDQLIIPEYQQAVTVVGEVQRPATHLYDRQNNANDYIDLSGGVKRKADEKGIYVVKANGSVALLGRPGWFKYRSTNIEMGDAIIVPLDIDRRRGLEVIGEASSIIYQLALGAAAVASL